MLKDDIEKYTNLTGEDGWNVPIMKVGAYLDGYNKGLDVLDKIKVIINTPNTIIQEDVLKYKMICEVLKNERYN